ncbi:MAG: hypothetical protein ACI8XM_000046 [Haloarculaceae archaeon]|jgi:hypothetical protein
MKSEHSGCLTVSDAHTTDAAGEAIKTTIDHLRETLERPFVAVELRTGETRSAYVFHDTILGQYVLVRRVDVHHIDDSYWRVTDGQPLSWLVEDLVEQVGSSFSVDVELVDKAVMRKRLSGVQFERAEGEQALDGGRREENHRTELFESLGSFSGFVYELTTEPVYSVDLENRVGTVKNAKWM